MPGLRTGTVFKALVAMAHSGGAAEPAAEDLRAQGMSEDEDHDSVLATEDGCRSQDSDASAFEETFVEADPLQMMRAAIATAQAQDGDTFKTAAPKPAETVAAAAQGGGAPGPAAAAPVAVLAEPVAAAPPWQQPPWHRPLQQPPWQSPQQLPPSPQKPPWQRPLQQPPWQRLQSPRLRPRSDWRLLPQSPQSLQSPWAVMHQCSLLRTTCCSR